MGNLKIGYNGIAEALYLDIAAVVRADGNGRVDDVRDHVHDLAQLVLGLGLLLFKLRAALVVGLLVVLLLQPYVLGPLSEWLVGRRVNIAWPWWCPIGGVVSFAVCCLGKKKNEK